MKKECELCDMPARMYCESDEASLCWFCDAKVHSANFLVAKHERSLLCHVCHLPTAWKASGGRVGPTVSVCVMCVRKCISNSGLEGEGENDEDDGDEEEEQGESSEDEENQVVPWSSTQPPPVSNSSSSSRCGDEDISDGAISGRVRNRGDDDEKDVGLCLLKPMKVQKREIESTQSDALLESLRKLHQEDLLISAKNGCAPTMILCNDSTASTSSNS